MTDNLQRALLYVAFAVAALLLARFTIDFYKEMPWWLAIPFSMLVAAALVVAAANLLMKRDGWSSAAISKPAKALLLAAIPLGFIASTLDCSGLAPQGCTPFCTFIKLGWIPLIAAACAAYFFKPAGWLLVVVGLMSFVTLAPHCVCYNVGNGWWMERIGASPMCYVWGFTVSLISLAALRSGRLVMASLLVNAAIIGGGLAFFVSHHYFHFPW